MSTRAAAAEVTRERILAAACEAFMRGWYDDVTLRDIAADAGVALQTLVNHFGGKEALFAAAAERIGQSISSMRWTVRGRRRRDAAAELSSTTTTRTGDFMLRTLAIEERVPAVAAGARAGSPRPPGMGRARFRGGAAGPARRGRANGASPSSSSPPTSTPGSCFAATRVSAATRPSPRSASSWRHCTTQTGGGTE